MVSETLSPLAAELEAAEETPRTEPPSLCMADSKLSLVLVLGSKNMVAKILPSQTCAYFGRFLSMSEARERSCSVSSTEKSSGLIKCLMEKIPFHHIVPIIPDTRRKFYKKIEKYDIMTAKRSLYLRIPVFAFIAKSRALKSAGGSWPRSGHDIITCIPTHTGGNHAENI